MEMWRLQAACLGQAAELFELPEGDDYDKEHTTSLLEAGRKTCFTCPVISECGNTATDDDFFYTVRAGQFPSGFGITPPDIPDEPKKNSVIRRFADSEIRDVEQLESDREEERLSLPDVSKSEWCPNGHPLTKRLIELFVSRASRKNHGFTKDGIRCRVCWNMIGSKYAKKLRRL